MEALKELLKSYKLQIINEVDNNIDINIKILKNQIFQTYNDLKKAEEQKSKIYDLLENGIYSTDVFLDRSNKNASKISELKAFITKLKEDEHRLVKLRNNQKNIIPRIENVINTYYKANNAEAKNKLLKTAIAKIEYLKENPKSPDDFELTIYPLF